MLASLFAQKAVKVASKEHPEQSSNEKSEMIGWEDHQYLYLLPLPARGAVVTALGKGGEHWPYSPGALYRALDRRGALVPNNDGRSPQQISVGGKKHKVIKIPKEAIEAGN